MLVYMDNILIFSKKPRIKPETNPPCPWDHLQRNPFPETQKMHLWHPRSRLPRNDHLPWASSHGPR
jgi:hypothetical protein